MERRTFLKMIVAAAVVPALPVPHMGGIVGPTLAQYCTADAIATRLWAKNYLYCMMYGGSPLILSKLRSA